MPRPASFAGEGPVDPSAAHRLPRALVPRRYDLHLRPDLDQARFEGTVRISGEAASDVREVLLHAVDLQVAEASASAAEGPAVPCDVELEPEHQRLRLRPAEPLPAGPLRLDLRFSGELNDRLHGFYRSTYTDPEGRTRTIATTQFEATHARRAFPCLDEPDAKAVFAITLDVPEGLLAVSNGPVVDEEPLAGGGRRVRFGDTMPMSTYLVAFVVGPLVATEPVRAGGTTLRVVHVPGKEGLTGFALEAAAHALDFFTDWFGLPYPADKLDLVAIPDFAFGAMENLGCVTFRETALLVDPGRASQLELQRVADVVSHEIAHMWFGDLVTMKWWNGIWLNEAFATFMELLCVDHFRPAWRRWVSFGLEREAALAVDGLHRTRPVEYPVGSPEEAEGMFDVLTYQKGASVLRMLERYLGEERFRDGIRRYLARHRYANTETTDLWDALEEASGEPVRQVMESWIFQGGHPLVTLAEGPSGPQLRQEPFTYGPPLPGEPSAIGRHWEVPLLVRALPEAPGPATGAEPGGSGGDGEARLLLGAEPTALPPLPGGGVPVLNAGGWGFYRVRYPRSTLETLAGRLGDLAVLERFGLLGDTWAAVLAGQADLADLLTLAGGLAPREDPDVLGQLAGALRSLERFLDEDDLGALAACTRAIVAPSLAELGFERQPGDDERTLTLRSLVVALAGTVGQDPEVQERCRALFAAEQAGRADLDPDLAPAVVQVVAASGDRSTYEQLLDRYRHPATPQEEMRFLVALADVPDPQVAAEVFELALSEVRTQNAAFVLAALLGSRLHGPATWERLTARWDEVLARTPENLAPRMLEAVRWLCRDRALAERVTDWLAAHPLRSGQRTVQQALERLWVHVGAVERLRSPAPAALQAATARLGEGRGAAGR
ncbi:M1 family aminopeptidase [Aciditerrimonas ferrireducens]|uniref:Aminopeptidase n=1 Tax=Aciditerrimonas ferrireducens TaxID=667306 RepID=A0ABV6C413_9ACTN